MQDPNELFFQVDENDKPVGAISRKEANSDNTKYHRAVNLFLKVGDKYLITVRAKNKDTFPGKFDLSVTGHVNHPEDYIGAIVRETEEEIGLSLDANRFKKLGKLLVNMPNENEFQMNYLVELNEEDSKKIKALEAEKIKYMTLKEIEESINNHPADWADWARESVQKFLV